MKAFVVDHNKLWKILKELKYQTTLPISWETCVQDKKWQLELDLEKLTGSKLGKEYFKVVYCHPAYLTSMQRHHVKCQAEQSEVKSEDYQEKKQQSQICRWYHSNGKSEEEPKTLWMKVKEESVKAGLKLDIQKTKIIASGPITSWQIDAEKMETGQTLFSWAPKSLWMMTETMKLKDTCSLGKSYDKPRHSIKKQRHHFSDKGPYWQSYGFSSSHV